MEETVDDETINQQDCHSGEWQTVLHAYRNRAPGSNSASKPLSAASVPAEPNASNASAPPDAASASARTASKEATQLLRTTRAVIQKSKQLAALPAGTIRVVFRPRGGLFLEKHPAASLLQALRTAVDGSLLGELHIRIHPTNNTFTVATAEEANSSGSSESTGDRYRWQAIPRSRVHRSPPAAVRGVISRAYWNETPEQILNDLRYRNPDANIIAARRMGKSASILITFASGPVPHTIKYMCVVHRCTKYKGSPDACTNCRKPGHRYDVCPPPKKWTVPTMRRGTREAREPLHADMHPLWWEPSYRHRLVQGQDAPASTTDITET
ncbi:hypothetical protein MTO96_045625 [Rhipicephalus appendiculatus]